MFVNKKENVKLQRYYVYKLFLSYLLKKGNKVESLHKLSRISFFLKKRNKRRKPLHLIFLAANILRPPLNVRTKKVAAQKIKLPYYITLVKAYTYSIRWLCEAALKGPLSSFEENMAQEVINVLHKRGNAYRKRLDMCKDFADSRTYFRFIK